MFKEIMCLHNTQVVHHTQKDLKTRVKVKNLTKSLLRIVSINVFKAHGSKKLSMFRKKTLKHLNLQSLMRHMMSRSVFYGDK